MKSGHIHGATDEMGFGATEGQVHVHDLHATLLHLLGFDHERLTTRFQAAISADGHSRQAGAGDHGLMAGLAKVCGIPPTRKTSQRSQVRAR